MNAVRVWILAAIIALSSVTAAGCAQPSGVPRGSTPVAMQRLFTEQHSGLEQRRRAVIASTADWQRIEAALARARTTTVPLSSVDFRRSMIILAAMGVQPTAGYTVAVDSVYRDGGRLWAVVREVKPGPGCLTAQVLTTPAAAVVVPRTEKPVMFVERIDTRPCP